MEYLYTTYSHKGKRARNEDAYFPVNGVNDSNLFFVCDGIGGHGDGDLASAFIKENLPNQLKSCNNLTQESLVQVFEKTDIDLKRYAMQVGNLNMGTTVALLKFTESKGLIAWIGDSRVYHFRNGEVLFKTKDHTLFQLMLENEKLSENEARDYPMKHVIYQALGSHGTPLKPSVVEVENVVHDDIFLLASDGLFEGCTEDEIIDTIKASEKNAADILYKRCLSNSKDNFTFTLVKAISS